MPSVFLLKAFFLEVRVHPSEVALSSQVGMWGCAEDFPPWRPNLKVKVELRKTKSVHCWPSRCYPSNCKRCSFSCLAFHSLVAAGEAQALIQHRKGKDFDSDKETH